MELSGHTVIDLTANKIINTYYLSSTHAQNNMCLKADFFLEIRCKWHIILSEHGTNH